MSENNLDFSDRNSLIHANAVLISQLQSRLKMKRWRVQEGESLRVSYFRTLILALQAQNAILKDSELDSLREEIEELKELMKCKQRE
jgi:hypothetical protein